MMMLKFPIDMDHQQALKAGATHYAMLKQRKAVHKRTIFLKENMAVFVIAGHKILHFEKHTVKVAAGNILLLKRGVYVMSDFVPDGLDFQSLLLYFSDEQVKRFLHKFGYATPVPHYTATHLTLPLTPLLEAFREQYVQYFSQPSANFASLLPVKQYELFLLLLDSPQRAAIQGFLQHIVQAQPEDIAWVVKTHLFQPLTLPELARLSGRSLASFKRDFQQQYHMPPRRWINEQRLAYAHTLLQTTSKQVAEIAIECGFENIPHFIRSFRQEYGTTPSAIRTKNAII
ncbi:helix-turn-helix domain-containing protein [Chitinophaga vietnamensis]|uniref:helix-turn-helix domain-containing protein n=1 Tax=Chitinophaga vietnamensis TaxID=2593957 RepID=UPI001376108C|nr:AraC family transcriptional regulator [Chitinophaga vietnamensis]